MSDVREKLNSIMLAATTLEEAIESARQAPSTIDQHWQTLVKYGREVSEVLEFGSGYSTLAWLSAGCRVTSVDVEAMDWMDRLLALAGGRLEWIYGSSLVIPPRPVVLLFIDTHHIYTQLTAELTLHGPLAEQIILHDTESFRDATSPLTRVYHPGDRGMWAAVEEFCTAYDYRIAEHFTHQHGLTILRKIA